MTDSGQSKEKPDPIKAKRGNTAKPNNATMHLQLLQISLHVRYTSVTRSHSTMD